MEQTRRAAAGHQEDATLHGQDKSPGTLGATIIISSLMNSALAASRLALPMIALGMGASLALVSLMSSLYTVAPMLLSIRFGRWVDHVGTLVPAATSCAVMIAAGGFYLLHPSQYVLLATAMLVGAGAVFGHVVATRAVSEGRNEVERTRNIGWLVMSYSFFQFAGPAAAGFAYEHFGSAAAMGVVSGIGTLALVGVAAGYHNFSRDPGPQPAAAPRRGGLDLLARPALRKWVVANGVFAAINTIYPLVVSLHAVETGLGSSRAALLLGFFSLGTMVSRAMVSRLNARFPAHAIVSVALVVAGLAYTALPFLRTFAMLSALSTLLGLVIGIGAPLSVSLIYKVAPEGRANESMGLCMAVTNLLQTATPLIFGLVASGSGVGPMVWSLAGAIAIAAILIRRPAKES